MRSTKGAEYTVLRPTLEDFVVEMPRGAQVIYPKDLAPICMLADIGPGSPGVRDRRRLGRAVDDDAALGRRHRRLRAARGLRQPGPSQRARASSVSGALDRYESSSRDSYEGIDPADGPFDRVVLDLPEPWQVVPHAERVLARRRHPRRLHAVDHPGRPGARGAQGPLDRRPHDRGAAPRLAHRGPGGATRPPHGRPHGVPHRRPLPRRPTDVHRRRLDRLMRVSRPTVCPRRRVAAAGDQGSMKMHSPGHSSADSITASSWPSGMWRGPRHPAGCPCVA